MGSHSQLHHSSAQRQRHKELISIVNQQKKTKEKMELENCDLAICMCTQ